MPYSSDSRSNDQSLDQAIDQKIQTLHRQLLELPSIEPTTQQQLLILQADINRLLESVHDTQDHSPAEAVETLAVRFDADHPALSSALRNLVDSLGKAGI